MGAIMKFFAFIVMISPSLVVFIMITLFVVVVVVAMFMIVPIFSPVISLPMFVGFLDS